MTCMRARTSLNFGLLRPLSAKLAALEGLIMGKTMSPPFSRLFLIGSFSYLQVKIIDYIHESLDEFEIWPDPTTGFHGNR